MISLKVTANTEKQKKDKEALREPMMKWHSTLREHLVKLEVANIIIPVYGGFVPAQRYNLDQSPLPFAIETQNPREQKQTCMCKPAGCWIRKTTVYSADLLSP